MSFILGGKTAAELKLKLLSDSQIPILPPTVDRTMSIPGKHGAHDFGADMGPRSIYLACSLVDEAITNDRELQEAVRSIARHLVDSRGNPRAIELRFMREPDKYYTVRYSGSLPIERLVALGTFTLPLTAFDPHAYGAEQEVEQLVEMSPATIAVESQGNVETPPVIVLENEGTNTIEGFVIRTLEEV